MNRGDTIEISSSPEPSSRETSTPSRPRKAQRHPRPAPQPVSRDNEVIVLTDSDEEGLPLALLARTESVRVYNSRKAGPSRLATPSRFGCARGPLSNNDSQPKAGPSGSGSAVKQTVIRKSPVKTLKTVLPLFVPSDDEKEPPEPQPGPRPKTPQPSIPITISDVVLLDPQDPDQFAPPEQVTPPPEANPIDGYVARVLEIIPDVQPEHLLALIQKVVPSYQDQTVERVLHLLFEDPTYPKIDKKGKRKRVEDDSTGEGRGKAKLKVDYGSKDREYKGGPSYVDIAIDQLFVDFPSIPKPYVRQTFFAQNTLYAPTYLFLDEEKKKGNLPYVPKKRPTQSKDKHKGKGKVVHDAEYENERQWLLLKLQEDAAGDEQDAEDCVDGIECGCCFSTYPFGKMIQCPETHLFCKTCMTAYASNLLGAHDANIVCMDQSGCKLAFPVSELSRFLTPKLIELYNRVKQQKEIEAAGLENLEECPFCEYKVVIENEHEKLFRCENNDCGVVSCRECKKVDHLPKSCKEMEEDKHLDGRHAIEEAMTRALTRNCPKCKTAFIKENGCNKMTCPNCQALSCYMCREIITGYEHFTNATRCALSDPIELRHHEDVMAAAKKALEDYKRDHPNVEEKDIKVDLPPPPLPPYQALINGQAMAAGYPHLLAQMGVNFNGQPAPAPVHYQPAPPPPVRRKPRRAKPPKRR